MAGAIFNRNHVDHLSDEEYEAKYGEKAWQDFIKKNIERSKKTKTKITKLEKMH